MIVFWTLFSVFASIFALVIFLIILDGLASGIEDELTIH